MPAPTEIFSVRCLILNEAGECLTVTRPQVPHGSDPGMIEFPGGKVDSGEDPASACIRETGEETGLTVEIISDPIDVGEFKVASGKRLGTPYRVIAYMGKIVGGRIGSGAEQLPVTWTPLHRMSADVRVVEASRAAARICSDRLGTMYS